MKAILAAAFIEVAVSTAAAVDFLWQEPEEPKLLSQELDRGVLLPIPINPPINPLQLQKMTPFDTVKEWLPVCKAHMAIAGGRTRTVA
jgi:hypothetical protein